MEQWGRLHQEWISLDWKVRINFEIARVWVRSNSCMGYDHWENTRCLCKLYKAECKIYEKERFDEAGKTEKRKYGHCMIGSYLRLPPAPSVYSPPLSCVNKL
mmetsp:Transcript_26417/g.38276  ORF Transcript_26417/g.38276 Transcript_26417/m.38276 type:complete len:102 (-) Transcript_26417:1213-1518(-)|eukprot:13760487-Ditylum_brightwellii.AAC.1